MNSDTKRACVTYYEKFMEQYNELTVDNLVDYYSFLDSKNKNCKGTIKKEYNQLKRILIESYGVKAKFPCVRFQSTRESKEENIAAIDARKVKDVIDLLQKKGNIRDSLLVHLMYSVASRPGEMCLIKFEDFKIKKKEYQVSIYQPKTRKKKTMSIPKELFDQVENYKQYLIKKHKYIEETRKTKRGDEKSGHFLFKLHRGSISRLFESRFNEMIPERLQFRAKDLRLCALNKLKSDKGIEAAKLAADHSKIKTTIVNYDRSAVDLNQEISKIDQA
jgi:integrase